MNISRDLYPDKENMQIYRLIDMKVQQIRGSEDTTTKDWHLFQKRNILHHVHIHSYLQYMGWKKAQQSKHPLSALCSQRKAESVYKIYKTQIFFPVTGGYFLEYTNFGIVCVWSFLSRFRQNIVNTVSSQS